MADITLYGVPVSAFVAKVRAVLDHKGLSYRETPPPGGYGSPEYRAIVPAGSVPGLVIGDVALHDSNAIVELLEEIAPEPPLLPSDPYDRAFVRALLGYHDTRLEASVRQLYPVVKTGAADTAAAETGFAAIDSAVERLEHLIDPAPFVMGAVPGFADLAYPTTLQLAEMITSELGRPLTLSAPLAAWRDASAEIPAVARSLGIARAATEDWLAQFR